MARGRSWAWPKRPPGFDAPGRVLLVADTANTALKWKSLLARSMPDRLTTVGIADAMRHIGRTDVPDGDRHGPARRSTRDRAQAADRTDRPSCDPRRRGDRGACGPARAAGRRSPSTGVQPKCWATARSAARWRCACADRSCANAGSKRCAARCAQGCRAAVIDPLTGLHNRRYAMPGLPGWSKRPPGSAGIAAVMVVDIDHFKMVNDTFGHAAGDAILSRIGHILREAMGQEALAARLGGEEFLIAMPDTGPEIAHMAAQRLCRLIAGTLFRIPGQPRPVRITVSIGVALASDPAPRDPATPRGNPASPATMPRARRPRALRRQGTWPQPASRSANGVQPPDRTHIAQSPRNAVSVQNASAVRSCRVRVCACAPAPHATVWHRQRARHRSCFPAAQATVHAPTARPRPRLHLPLDARPHHLGLIGRALQRGDQLLELGPDRGPVGGAGRDRPRASRGPARAGPRRSAPAPSAAHLIHSRRARILAEPVCGHDPHHQPHDHRLSANEANNTIRNLRPGRGACPFGVVFIPHPPHPPGPSRKIKAETAADISERNHVIRPAAHNRGPRASPTPSVGLNPIQSPATRRRGPARPSRAIRPARPTGPSPGARASCGRPGTAIAACSATHRPEPAPSAPHPALPVPSAPCANSASSLSSVSRSVSVIAIPQCIAPARPVPRPAPSCPVRSGSRPPRCRSP